MLGIQNLVPGNKELMIGLYCQALYTSGRSLKNIDKNKDTHCHCSRGLPLTMFTKELLLHHPRNKKQSDPMSGGLLFLEQTMLKLQSSKGLPA